MSHTHKNRNVSATHSPAQHNSTLNAEIPSLEEALAALTASNYIAANTTPGVTECALILEQMTTISSGRTSERQKEMTNLKQGVLAIAAILKTLTMDTVMKAAYNVLTEYKEEIRETIEEAVASDLTKTTHDQLQVMHSWMGEEMKGWKKEMSEQIKKVEFAVTKHTTDLEEGEIRTRTTYAEIARHGPTKLPHMKIDADRAIAQTALLQSQLVLQPDPSLPYNNIGDLGDKEAREMINMAIDEARKTSYIPQEITITGTKRTRGGAIIVQASSTTAGEWLQQPEALKIINNTMKRAMLKPVTFNVLLKFLPITTDIDSNNFLRNLAEENSIAPEHVHSAWWTKQPS